MLKAIVFDFDGTLVSGTNDGYFLCYNQAAFEAGFDISLEKTKIRVLEQWGKSPRIELQSVLRERLDLVDLALEKYEVVLRSELFVKPVVSVKGAADALAFIRSKDISTFVISSMAEDHLISFSKKFNFNFPNENLISTIKTDDPEKQKTTGYSLISLMNKNNWDANEVIVIGDASSDIVMAKVANVEPIIVLTGILDLATAESYGVRVIDSVADLPGAVLKN